MTVARFDEETIGEIERMLEGDLLTASLADAFRYTAEEVQEATKRIQQKRCAKASQPTQSHDFQGRVSHASAGLYHQQNKVENQTTEVKETKSSYCALI
jgi:hypothetical protein